MFSLLFFLASQLISLVSLSPALLHLSIAFFARLLGLFLVGFHSTTALKYSKFDFLITCPNHFILCAFTKLVILETPVKSGIPLFLHLRQYHSSLSYAGPLMVLSILFLNDISFCSILLVKDHTTHPYVNIQSNYRRVICLLVILENGLDFKYLVYENDVFSTLMIRLVNLIIQSL